MQYIKILGDPKDPMDVRSYYFHSNGVSILIEY